MWSEWYRRGNPPTGRLIQVYCICEGTGKGKLFEGVLEGLLLDRYGWFVGEPGPDLRTPWKAVCWRVWTEAQNENLEEFEEMAET